MELSLDATRSRISARSARQGAELILANHSPWKALAYPKGNRFMIFVSRNSFSGLQRGCALLLGIWLVVFSSGSSGAAPHQAPRCTRITFSTDKVNDHLGFCAGSILSPATASVSGVALYVTKNGGESWQRRGAEGIVVDNADVGIGQLILSPNYQEDRSLYLQTSKGLHLSTDEGRTFSLIDGLTPTESGWDRLAPYLENDPLDGQETAFAWANSVAPARIRPPLHSPVLGTPFDEAMFLIPDDIDVRLDETFSIATTSGAGGFTTHLFSCRFPFNCSQPLFSFPADMHFEDAWIDPRPGRSGSVIVALRPPLAEREPLEIWRSDDAGRNFTRWRAVNRLLRSDAELHSSDVDFAMNKHRDEAYLQISLRFDDVDPPSPPAHRIFRSTGNHDRWKLVAFGRSSGQEGKRGQLWSSYPSRGPDLHLRRSGAIVALGQAAFTSPFCSTDQGRTWNNFC